MISSTSNSRIREIVQLKKKARERRRQGVFLVEGLRLYEEVPTERILSTFLSDSFQKNRAGMRAVEERGLPFETVTDTVFAYMSDTKTPQGILCVVRQPSYTLGDLLAGERTHLLVLENIQDPGNLGTMFRTGEGAGLTGLILDASSADLFAPKTVRSTMGSIFRVPFVQVETLEETAEELKRNQVAVYAAHLKGEKSYDAYDYRGGTAFLIGNEAKGLSGQMTAKANHLLKIPMQGKLESLNAAMAAGILMYEVSRQRRLP